MKSESSPGLSPEISPELSPELSYANSEQFNVTQADVTTENETAHPETNTDNASKKNSQFSFWKHWEHTG